ncbi:MAG: sugar transferase [Fimbriimonadaceae bacterium]
MATLMNSKASKQGLSLADRFVKRAFDITFALIGLLLTWPIILVAWIIASIDTRMGGFFMQRRVGKDGKVFRVVKIRSMRHIPGYTTTSTTSHDPRITKSGRFFRKAKIDELPQLWNVLWGQMSFVGPRPDVPGYADKLDGDDRIVLSIRPGITGPATLFYRNEEEILAEQEDPETYNDTVIWPNKVRMNREYIENYRFSDDIKYILETVFKRSSRD